MRLDPRTSGFARIRGRIWLTGRAGDLQYDAVGVAQIDRPLGSVVFFLEVDARAAQSLAPRIERGIITYGERIVRQIRDAGDAFFARYGEGTQGQLMPAAQPEDHHQTLPPDPVRPAERRAKGQTTQN